MIQAIRDGLSIGTARLKRAKLLRIKTVRRFARGEDGVAAVEFGMVAAPFLALMFAIMETSLVFFAGQTLETAVADSARLIMTGQAQASGLTQETFKTEVCNRIAGLFDCSAGMQIDVKAYAAGSTFADVSTAKPINAADKTLQTSTFGYQPGTACNIVVVRLMYQWPVYMSLLGFNLADLAGNKRLLMATAAFRNEPFGSSSC
jgi:Flp pilus assembly protein TadG